MGIVKYLAALLISALLCSCGDGERVYDYKNVDKTEGLDVTPSVLELTEEKPDGYFTLRYSPEELFFLGLNTDKLTDNFSLEPKFTADGCLASIETSGECRINVSYVPGGDGKHSGTIVLKFLYPGDREAEQAKDHELKVTGVSASDTPEDNSTPGG